MFYTLHFEPIDQPPLQQQHQIKHLLQSEIPTIAGYVEETAIYFLQFLMEIVHFTCIIGIGLLVAIVVCDAINVIATS